MSQIIAAVKRNDLAAVREYLEKDPSCVNEADSDGVTLLHCFFHLTKMLVQSGAKIDSQTIQDGHTPLAYAAIKGRADCFHYLISQNVVDTPDKKGYYSIHHAAMYDQTDILFLVLHFKVAPIDITDLQGHTALMWAVYEGHIQSVNYLLSHGAIVELKDHMGFTALHWAALRNKRDCCEILVKKNQDLLNMRDANNETPLMVAKSHDHITLVEYLDLIQNDPRVAKKGRYEVFKYQMFMFPLGVYTYLALFVSYVPFFYIPIGFLFTLVLYVGFWRLYLQRRWTGLTISRNPYLVGQVWWGMTVSSALWQFHITSFDQTFTIPSLMWYTWAFVFTYLYHLLILRDPGFLDTNTSSNEEIVESLSGANEDKHCLTCRLKKPLKSKHCKNTGRCIYRFDHYCAWLANAVGGNNHVHFIGLIVCVSLGHWIFVGICINFLYSTITLSDTYSIISLPRIIYEQEPLVLVALIGHIVTGVIHTHLVYNQFQLISSNLTTNEVKNYARYYPGMTEHEDYGTWNNIREFFFPTIDWKTKFKERDSRNISINMQY